jgi:hypothetical protein
MIYNGGEATIYYIVLARAVTAASTGKPCVGSKCPREMLLVRNLPYVNTNLSTTSI